MERIIRTQFSKVQLFRWASAFRGLLTLALVFTSAWLAPVSSHELLNCDAPSDRQAINCQIDQHNHENNDPLLEYPALPKNSDNQISLPWPTSTSTCMLVDCIACFEIDPVICISAHGDSDLSPLGGQCMICPSPHD